jgi:hypothetical protein
MTCRVWTIGWSTPKGGTQGALAEYRIWNVERKPAEIRTNMTRTFAGETPPGGPRLRLGERRRRLG